MPRVTVYVRNEDYPKWKAVKEKTEFIHNSLNHSKLTHLQELVNRNPVLNDHIDKEKLDRLVAIEPVPQPIEEVFGFKLCKHGASPEFCKFARVVNGKKICK